MLKSLAGLAFGLLLCPTAYGQTADECIAKYEELKPEFDKLSSAAAVDCAQDGHIISLDREGDEQDLPAECVGVERVVNGAWIEGVESHWHLRAQAVLGPSPSCSVRLLGFTGRALELHPACGTPEFHIDLPANEGARWRNYLLDECGQ